MGGTLNSSPNTTYQLDFYGNATANASGSGAGANVSWLGRGSHQSGGDAAFSYLLPKPVPSGQFVTATATDPFGNTSEFSDAAMLRATDRTRPASRVSSAVLLSHSSQIRVTATGSDPQPGSGVAFFDLYVSVDKRGWTKFATHLPASDPMATYVRKATIPIGLPAWRRTSLETWNAKLSRRRPRS